MSSNNKKFILNLILWLGVSLGISFAIAMILPFPISLVVIFGVFVLFNLYLRRKMMRKTGSMTGSIFGSSDNFSLKYYCMNCGTQHSKSACPKCGSKMKRVGS
jgi:cobalamin synthase